MIFHLVLFIYVLFLFFILFVCVGGGVGVRKIFLLGGGGIKIIIPLWRRYLTVFFVGVQSNYSEVFQGF